MRPHPPERVEEFVAAGWWSHDPARSWDELLRARAAERPDATALVDPANRLDLLGSEPRRLTWAQLDAAVTDTAARLAGHGTGVDDVVGTQLPNVVELLVTTLAITRLGAIVCPFPTAYREHELSTLAPVAGLTAMVTVPSLGGRDLAASAKATGVPVLVWGADGLAADAVPGPVERVRRHPSEAVTLCWTSGTEASPKAVPRCANSWHVIGTGCAAAPALTADDVILSPFPLDHLPPPVRHADVPAPDRDRAGQLHARAACAAGRDARRARADGRRRPVVASGDRVRFGAAAAAADRAVARAHRDRGDQLLRLQRGHRPDLRPAHGPRPGAARRVLPVVRRARPGRRDPAVAEPDRGRVRHPPGRPGDRRGDHDAGPSGRAARGRPDGVRRLSPTRRPSSRWSGHCASGGSRPTSSRSASRSWTPCRATRSARCSSASCAPALA